MSDVQRLGLTVWFTGLPAAGKSTLARAVEDRLRRDGTGAAVLDGDEMRATICRDLGFSLSDRAENLRRIAYVARLMVESGLVVVVATISPMAEHRGIAREIHEGVRFVEVHLDTPLALCVARDPKRLYARALAGELTDFTGIDGPYEPPTQPEAVIDGTTALAEQVATVLRLVSETKLSSSSDRRR